MVSSLLCRDITQETSEVYDKKHRKWHKQLASTLGTMQEMQIITPNKPESNNASNLWLRQALR